jgi:hypothetical protein
LREGKAIDHGFDRDGQRVFFGDSGTQHGLVLHLLFVSRNHAGGVATVDTHKQLRRPSL